MDEVIRSATTADIPSLVASSAALFAEDAGTRDPTMNIDWPKQHGAQQFTENVDDPDRLVLVAEADGSVVGYLTGLLGEPTTKRPVRVATLGSLYVHPSQRGSQIGTRLVERFRSWARDKGADRLAVTAYASNESAIRFYQRQGFTPHTQVLESIP